MSKYEELMQAAAASKSSGGSSSNSQSAGAKPSSSQSGSTNVSQYQRLLNAANAATGKTTTPSVPTSTGNLSQSYSQYYDEYLKNSGKTRSTTKTSRFSASSGVDYAGKEKKYAQRQIEKLQQQIANVKSTRGSFGFDVSKAAGYKQQLSELQKQLNDYQLDYDAADSYINSYNDYSAGEAARKAAKASGLDGLNWYDDVKAKYDAVSKELTDLQRKGMRSTYTDVDVDALAAGDANARAQLGQNMSASTSAIEAKAKEKAELAKQLRYASRYRYDDVVTSSAKIAQGKATYEQRHQDWTDAQTAHNKDYYGTGESAAERAERSRYAYDTAVAAQFGLPEPNRADYNFSDARVGVDATQSLYDIYKYDKSYQEPTDQWTQQQKNIYFTLLGDGHDTRQADEYAKNVNDAYQNAKNEIKAQKYADAATSDVKHGIGMSIAAAGAGLVSGFEYLTDVQENAARGTITEKSFGVSDYSQAVTGAISNHLNNKYGTIQGGFMDGKGWGDAYQVAQSILQSWEAMAVGFAVGGVAGSAALGSITTNAMFFGNAAKTTLDEQLKKGIDPNKAVAYAALSGIAEVMGESFSIENLKYFKTGQIKSFMQGVARQAFIEGSEEGFTTLLNTFSDNLVNGSDSDYYAAMASYISQGMSYGDAANAAFKDWAKGIAWDTLGGALSGGISGGTIGPALSATTNAAVSQLTQYDGTEENLIAKGTSLDIAYAKELERRYGIKAQEERAEAYKAAQEKGGFAGAVGKIANRERHISVAQATKLNNKISETLSSQNETKTKTAITNELKNRGVTQNLGDLNEAVYKSAMDEKLTKAEQTALDGSEQAQAIRDELKQQMRDGVDLNSEDAPQWLKNAGLTDINKELVKANYGVDLDALDTEVKRTSAERDVSVKVGKVEGKLSGMEMVDGKPMFSVTDSKGNKSNVSLSDALTKGNLSEGVQQLAYLAAGQGDYASEIFNLYQNGQTINEYVAAMDTAINTVAPNVATREAMDKAKGLEELTKAQKDYAWKVGQDTKTKRKEAAKAKQDGRKKTEHKKGYVKFSGAKTALGDDYYHPTSKSKVKEADLRVIEKLAEVTGVNFVFYETRKDSSGNYVGANGVYKNGTVYLDVNAGLDRTHTQNAILLTAAHELTHHIAENAPEQYQALQDFVTDVLIKDGHDFSALVNSRMSQYNMSRELAIEEVTADACEMVLGNSKAVETMAKEQPSLFQSIADWLKGFFEDIKAAFTGVEAQHTESKAMVKYMDELTKLWDAGLVETKGSSKGSETKKSDRYETAGVHWGYNTGAFTKADASFIWKTIADVQKLGYNGYARTKNGEIIADKGNKIFFIIPNFEKPVVTRFVVLDDTNETRMALAKEWLRDASTVRGYDAARETIENYYGETYFTGYSRKDFQTDARKERGGEGKNRSGDFAQNREGRNPLRYHFEDNPDGSVEVTKYSFGGRNSQSADKSLLQQAEDMELQGVSDEQIRQKTGWFRGYDKKWRYEIDDSKMQFDATGNMRYAKSKQTYIKEYNQAFKELTAAINAMEDSGSLRDDLSQYIKARRNDVYDGSTEKLDNKLMAALGEKFDKFATYLEGTIETAAAPDEGGYLPDYIDHEDLFKAYPELRNAEVQIMKMQGNRNGSYSIGYDGKTAFIQLNEDLLNKPNEMKKTLIHEIQHAIQGYESHARGANVSYWDRQIKSGYDTRRQAVKQKYQELREYFDNLKETQPEYYKDMMELEAQTPDMPRGKILDWETLEQEPDPPEWEAFDAKRDALEEKYGDEIFNFMDKYYDFQKAQNAAGRTATELYYDTAGEIEARDTANRVNMTAEERKAKRPDIDNPDAVVRFSMREPVEETDRLIALHNKSTSGVLRMLKRGGVPFPSIAIKKAGSAHEGFGDCTIVFPKETIDPEFSRWNRLYSNDAWTPTEPRTEYDVADTYKLKRSFENMLGTDVFRALKGDSYLDSDQIASDLRDAQGDIFEAVKGRAAVKYGYLQSIGKRPAMPTTEKTLDGFGRYKNDQLLAIFNQIDGDRIAEADYGDTELLQEIADILNAHLLEKSAGKESKLKRFKGKPLYDADNIRLTNIQDAYNMWNNAGRTVPTVDDAYALERELKNDTTLEEDENYRRWVEDMFDGIIADSGISNGKDLFTSSGNRRSFKQTHVPATLENIVQQMRKENETGIGAIGGINLRGAATKTYDTIEDMRQDSGRLLGTHITDEVYDSYMKDFHQRLNDLDYVAAKEDSWQSRDTAEEILLTAIRDCKTKTAMNTQLRKEARWINYSAELVESLWQLKQDVQNMPAPYFEAKPRRNVTPDEAAAYVIPNNAPAALISELERQHLNYSMYQAGNEADRLAKVNAVLDTNTDLMFSQRGDAVPLTAQEAREQEKAITALKAETASLQRRLEHWKNETKRTKVQTVRREDANRYLNTLLKSAEYSDIKLDQETRQQLQQALYDMGNYLVQGNSETLDSNELWHRAQEIAEAMLSYGQELADSGYEQQERRDIINQIKGYKLYLDQQYAGDVNGVKDFRKQYFGRLDISTKMQTGKGEMRTGIDQAYAELSQAYPDLFPVEISNPADQLLRMADALDELQDQYINPYEQYWGEHVASLANTIVDDVLSGQLRQTAKTYADKAEEKLEKQKAKDQQKLDKLREQKNERIKEMKRSAAAAVDAARKEEKAAKWDKVQALKDYYTAQAKRATERRRESAATKKYRDRVIASVDTLQKWLIKNTDKEHVPEQLKAPLTVLLDSLDMRSKRQLKGGQATQNYRRFVRQMDKLQKVLANQQKYQDNPGEGDGISGVFIDLPAGFSDELRDYVTSVEEILDGDLDVELTTPIGAMSSDQLRDLSHILTTLTKAIQSINQYKTESHFASVHEASKSSTADMKKLGETQSKGTVADAAAKFMMWSNVVPVYVFKRFGQAGSERFLQVQKGWGKMAMNVKKTMEFVDKAYTSKEVNEWEAHTRKVTLESGETVTLSDSQMMGIYCLAKREQGLKHILVGGIRVGDIETKDKLGGKKTLKQTLPVHVTQADLATIGGMLSDRQIEVAQSLQEYMNTQCAEWGNEISMERFGYRQFTEENYYPLTINPNNKMVEDVEEHGNSLMKLLNMSFTKALNPNANNSVVVNSIFDVFANHAADMAKYNALALPILDMLKWYNYKDTSYKDGVDSDGNATMQRTTNSVMEAMEFTYGNDAKEYFLNFVKDLNGTREGGRGEGGLKGIMGHFKAAAVGANLRVAIQQPTSIARAAYMIDPKYLTQGAMMKGGIDEALEHSGLAVWKDLGYFDTNIQRGMRDQIKHNETWQDNLTEKAMTLAEKGDKATWGTIWNACKLEVQEKQHLTGDALMQATTERFDEIIMHTQVMDSTITRSDIMRNKSAFVRDMTSFMSEPTLSYNMMMDGAVDYRLAQRAGSYRGTAEAKRKLMKGIMVFAINAALTSAAAAIVDAFRDEDDYETWAQKWQEHVIENMKDNIAPWKLLPGLQDAVEILATGKAPQSTFWQPIQQLQKAAAVAWEGIGFVTGRIKEPTISKNYGPSWYVYTVLQGISSACGLPMATGFRDALALYNTVAQEFGWKTFKRYNKSAESSIKAAFQSGYISEDKASALLLEDGEYTDANDAFWKVQEWANDDDDSWTKYNDLNAAIMANDKTAFEDAMDELEGHGVTSEAIRAQVKKQVGEWFTAEKQQISKTNAEAALKTFAEMSDREVRLQMLEWQCVLTTGYKVNELQEAYVSGNLKQYDTVRYLTKYADETQRDAEEKVLQWKMEKDTGIKYSKLSQSYIYNEVSESQAISYLQQYGGLGQEEAQEKLRAWNLAKDYGLTLGSSSNGIKKALVDEDITFDMAVELYKTYGGNTQEEAEDYAYQALFTKETGGYKWSEVQDAYNDGVLSDSQLLYWYENASSTTHGSEETSLTYVEIAKWKRDVPGADKINATAISKWNQFEGRLKNQGLDKEDFALAWAIKSKQKAQYDSKGNKTVDAAQAGIEAIGQLDGYTREQKSMLARSVYSKSQINKYRNW